MSMAMSRMGGFTEHILSETEAIRDYPFRHAHEGQLGLVETLLMPRGFIFVVGRKIKGAHFKKAGVQTIMTMMTISQEEFRPCQPACGQLLRRKQN